MKRETVLMIFCGVLLLALVLLAVFGCKCKCAAAPATTETFEVEEEDVQLTPEEEEMFKNIQTGTLNDQDIQQMVESGKITEKMVEKFLSYLDKVPEKGSTHAKQPVKKVGRAVVIGKPETFGEDIEPFTGDMYAPA